MLKKCFAALGFILVSGFGSGTYATSVALPTEQDGGIKVVGKSLNPPKQYAVNRGKIWFTITGVDKNKAVDDGGHT
ncbi:MAG: hypothetical protein AB1299_08245 [Thermoproteota archaeon]|jgi:hypothetical protein